MKVIDERWPTANESRLSSEISVAQSVEPPRSAAQMPEEARSGSTGTVSLCTRSRRERLSSQADSFLGGASAADN